LSLCGSLLRGLLEGVFELQAAQLDVGLSRGVEALIRRVRRLPSFVLIIYIIIVVDLLRLFDRGLGQSPDLHLQVLYVLVVLDDDLLQSCGVVAPEFISDGLF